MKRHRIGTLVGLLLLVSMLVGCAAPATPAAQQAPQATTAPAQSTAAPAPTAAVAVTKAPEPTKAPVAATKAPEKKTLRLLWWQAPTILNSHLSAGNKDSEAARLILEPLAAWNEKSELVPVLAAEIPTTANRGVASDFTSITWKLKQGVKWSDGSEFTADDVIFNYQYLSNKDVASADMGVYTTISKVEALDKYTIKATFSSPTPNCYQAFVAGYGLMLQKKQFEAFNGKNTNDAPGNMAPIGTGPYKLVSFKPGDVIIYERNPLYRDAAKVYFDEVIMKGGGDAVSAARAVLQTGDYDMAGTLTIEQDVLQKLMADGKKGIVETAPSGFTVRILLNHANPDPALGDKRSEPGTKHPFLSDARVRRALSMAVDRETIIKQLYGLTGTPTCNFISYPPSLVSQKHAWGTCPMDLAGAKKLLDEAGWKDTNGNGMRDKDGVEMKMLFTTNTNALNQKIQEVVKAGWEQLGIRVELKSVDTGVHYSSDPANPDTASKFYADAEMYANGISAGTAAVIRYMQFWVSTNAAAKANNWGGRNVERYNSPEFDELYKKISVETDEAKRREMAIKMNDILVEDAVAIPIVLRMNVVARSNDLKGFVLSPSDSQTWNIAEWYK